MSESEHVISVSRDQFTHLFSWYCSCRASGHGTPNTRDGQMKHAQKHIPEQQPDPFLAWLDEEIDRYDQQARFEKDLGYVSAYNNKQFALMDARDKYKELKGK